MLITLEKAKVITREVKYIARRSHGNQIPELDQCILILLCKTYMGLVRGLHINREKVRLRGAGFPQLKYLQDLLRAELPEDGRNKLPELETLDFIKDGRNIILGGSPGTGKSHMAIGLGIKACMEGHSVMFTQVSKLLTQIRESHSSRTLRVLESRFEKYDLVICDELGYISFDKQGAEMLFNHLSLRSGIKSTIITSNQSFDKWQDIFGKDTILTAALLDRLTHKAHLVNMNGKSYRMKETKKMIAPEIKAA